MPITPPKHENEQQNVQGSRFQRIVDGAAAVLLGLTVFLLLLLILITPKEETCQPQNNMNLQLERLQLWKA